MSALGTLNRRERIILIVGGLLLIALLLWRFAWLPIQADRAETRADIARYLALSRLAERAGELREVVPQASLAAQGPIAQRVTRSAEAAGVVLARIEPQGGRLTLVVEVAAFGDILNWIVTLEREEAIRTAALEVDRQTAPGTVSARLTVEGTP